MTEDKYTANLTKVKSLQLSEYSKIFLGLSDFLYIFDHYDHDICFKNSITKLVNK